MCNEPEDRDLDKEEAETQDSEAHSQDVELRRSARRIIREWARLCPWAESLSWISVCQFVRILGAEEVLDAVYSTAARDLPDDARDRYCYGILHCKRRARQERVLRDG